MRKQGHNSMAVECPNWIVKQWAISIENLRSRPEHRRGAFLITDEQLLLVEETLQLKQEVSLPLPSRQIVKAA